MKYSLWRRYEFALTLKNYGVEHILYRIRQSCTCDRRNNYIQHNFEIP
jgi:hypothetical protein